jgi:excisionase family DNA binding protein
MTGSLLTAAEVADLLGVPTSWVYEQSRRGRIPTVKGGGRLPPLPQKSDGGLD